MKYSVIELRRLLQLAWPIFLAQISQSLMYFVDTVMSGRYDPVDLAGISISLGIWAPITFTMQGLLQAITPIISHHRGQSQLEKIKPIVQQGLYLSVFCTLCVLMLFQFIHIPLNLIDVSPEIRRISLAYLHNLMWGFPAMLGMFVLRGFVEGIGDTKPIMIVSFIGLLVNIPANYIFIYGKLGMPALGGAGCGIATSLVNWAMFICMLGFTSRIKGLKEFGILKHWTGINVELQKAIIKLGTPMALAMLFEVSLFAVIPMLVAPFGATEIAGLQIALNYSSIIFMVPLSLALASTIRISYILGMNNIPNLAFAINTVLKTAIFMAFMVALLTFFFRFNVANIYSSDPAVIELAASILVLSCLYQISDAIQVICSGILRGLKHTKPIILITFFSYWPLGLSIGVVLGLTDWIVPAMGARGFWIGIIVGLSCAAILLYIQLKARLKQLQDQQTSVDNETFE